MADSYTQRLKRVLKDNDCSFYRQGKGDHEIWYSPITDRKFPVDSHIPSRHLANEVLNRRGSRKNSDPALHRHRALRLRWISPQPEGALATMRRWRC